MSAPAKATRAVIDGMRALGRMEPRAQKVEVSSDTLRALVVHAHRTLPEDEIEWVSVGTTMWDIDQNWDAHRKEIGR